MNLDFQNYFTTLAAGNIDENVEKPLSWRILI